MSKVDWNVSRKKILTINDTFDRQDTKSYVTLDTLFTITKNYGRGLLRMRNHAWCSGYNHGNNIGRLSDVSPNFLFTKSETRRDY